MTADQQHMARIRRAMRKLLAARNYNAQVARLVKEAERELQQAVKSATPTPEPTGGGERKAA